jgi:hypothetical protein
MNNFKCSVCGSIKIAHIKGKSGINGAGGNIPMNPGFAIVTKNICCECGHIDSFILDRKDLNKIREKYLKEGN